MMMNPRHLGFSPYVQDYRQRGEALVEEIDNAKREKLAELERYRLGEYWENLRVFARKQAAGMLGVEEDSEAALALATAAADLALQMSNKFSLPMAEILVLGETQGDLPTFETERIIG